MGRPRLRRDEDLVKSDVEKVRPKNDRRDLTSGRECSVRFRLLYTEQQRQKKKKKIYFIINASIFFF